MNATKTTGAGPIPRIYTDRNGYAFTKAGGRMVRLGRADDPESRTRFEEFRRQWVTGGFRWPDDEGAEALSVGRLAERFVSHAEGYYGTSREIERVRLALTHWTRFYGDHRPAVEFGAKDALAFRAHLLGQGLSTSYVRGLMGALHRMVSWAVVEGLLPADARHRLEALPRLRVGREGARPPKERHPVPEADLERTIPYLPPMLGAAVRLLALTGARPSELLGLRMRDLDRKGEVWTAVLREHKNAGKGKSRTLYFGPKAQAVLASLMVFDRDAYVFCPARADALRQAERRAKRRLPRWASHDPDVRRMRKGTKPVVHAAHYEADVLGRAVARAVVEANETAKADAVAAVLVEAGTPRDVVLRIKARLRRQTITAETVQGVVLGEREAAEYLKAALEALEAMDLIERWTPYQLRHLCATKLRRELTLEHARAALGHSAAEMTETYAELDSALAVEAAKRQG